MTHKVLVIISSVRPRRLTPSIAEWISRIGPTKISADFEIIDLKDWELPANEEPEIPKTGIYETGHTKEWSEKIRSAAGFVFVSPQYNGGYPAPLKNAIDHLYNEWKGKPAVVVTFGARGGGSASEQLRVVLTFVGILTMPTMPQLPVPHELFGSDGFDAETVLKYHQPVLEKAITELGEALRK